MGGRQRGNSELWWRGEKKGYEERKERDKEEKRRHKGSGLQTVWFARGS